MGLLLFSYPYNQSGMERLLNISEVAEILRISPSTLREWVFMRKIPFIKVGRRVVFDPKDIQEFIRKNRVELPS